MTADHPSQANESEVARICAPAQAPRMPRTRRRESRPGQIPYPPGALPNRRARVVRLGAVPAKYLYLPTAYFPMTRGMELATRGATVGRGYLRARPIGHGPYSGPR